MASSPDTVCFVIQPRELTLVTTTPCCLAMHPADSENQGQSGESIRPVTWETWVPILPAVSLLKA